MRRWVLRIAAAASLLVCVGTVVLWVRSYRGVYFRFGPTRWETTVVAIRNGTVAWHGPQESAGPIVFEYGLWRVPAGLAVAWVCTILFRRMCNGGGLALLAVLIHVTACAFGALLAAPAILLFDLLLLAHLLAQAIDGRHAKSKARNKGLCAVCGYDLRATPNRCPECGTPAAGPLH